MSERDMAAARPPVGPASGSARSDDLVAELHEALERASELIHDLRQADATPPPARDPGAEKLSLLRQRLAAAEAELNELSDRLVETEHQRGPDQDQRPDIDDVDECKQRLVRGHCLEQPGEPAF